MWSQHRADSCHRNWGQERKKGFIKEEGGGIVTQAQRMCKNARCRQSSEGESVKSLGTVPRARGSLVPGTQGVVWMSYESLGCTGSPRPCCKGASRPC